MDESGCLRAKVQWLLSGMSNTPNQKLRRICAWFQVHTEPFPGKWHEHALQPISIKRPLGSFQDGDGRKRNLIVCQKAFSIGTDRLAQQDCHRSPSWPNLHATAVVGPQILYAPSSKSNARHQRSGVISSWPDKCLRYRLASSTSKNRSLSLWATMSQIKVTSFGAPVS